MEANFWKQCAALALSAAFLGASFTVHGQAAKAESKSGEFQPQVGQAGKDVIWVPTPDELV